MGLIDRLHRWTSAKIEERLLKRFGGIQTCPYCLQTVQRGDGWSITPWDRDPMLDVIRCGCCGGESLWRFELCMIYIGPLIPPEPKHIANGWYDIKNACLRPSPPIGE